MGFVQDLSSKRTSFFSRKVHWYSDLTYEQAFASYFSSAGFQKVHAYQSMAWYVKWFYWLFNVGNVITHLRVFSAFSVMSTIYDVPGVVREEKKYDFVDYSVRVQDQGYLLEHKAKTIMLSLDPSVAGLGIALARVVLSKCDSLEEIGQVFQFLLTREQMLYLNANELQGDLKDFLGVLAQKIGYLDLVCQDNEPGSQGVTFYFSEQKGEKKEQQNFDYTDWVQFVLEGNPIGPLGLRLCCGYAKILLDSLNEKLNPNKYKWIIQLSPNDEGVDLVLAQKLSMIKCLLEYSSFMVNCTETTRDGPQEMRSASRSIGCCRLLFHLIAGLLDRDKALSEELLDAIVFPAPRHVPEVGILQPKYYVAGTYLLQKLRHSNFQMQMQLNEGVARRSR